MSTTMAIPSLAGVPKDVAERAAPIVIRILAKNMRTETPVGKTGSLKRSVRSRVLKTGADLGWVSLGLGRGVKPASYYAHLVVGGTNPHSLAPGSGKYGWGKGAGGKLMYAKWGMSKRKWGWHPGTAPNPVLERTLTRSDAQIARDVETAMHQALQKAIARAK